MMILPALLANANTLFTGSASRAAFTLGQNTGSSQNTPVSLKQGVDILVGLGWLVAAVMLIIVAAVFLRKWLLRDDVTSQGTQFTLADLRQMRDQGLLSQEEFDRTKMFLVSRGRAMLHDPTAEEQDNQEQTKEKQAKEERAENDASPDDSQKHGDSPRNPPADPPAKPPMGV